MAQSETLEILQIVREPITPGSEAAYEMVENETALACVELKCPHPHLALETLGSPKEIWWLNFFGSESERQQVIDDYAQNRPLMEALAHNSERKSKFTGELVDLLLTYRVDLSRNARWDVAGNRFAVVTISAEAIETEGFFFEASDGSHFIFQLTQTRAEAERLAAADSRATILAVRPSWGMPAKEWIDADRDFWISNPTAYRQESASR